MDHSKRDFIDFMCSAEVLTFGDFVTKSGRSTPYFVNTGLYRSGMQMATLGRAYADAIEQAFPGFNDEKYWHTYLNAIEDKRTGNNWNLLPPLL